MKYILYIFSILLIPFTLSAQVKITEIMYDLEGSDSGREWIEICNSGNDSVDIDGWKFFENGSNHGLSLVDGYGDKTLLSGESAVIVSDDSKFLIDWPAFSGTLFDSSFSLSNTGELLEIRDTELATTDSYTYSSETGASGDGNTLTLSGDVWVPALATPGDADCVEAVEEDNQETQNQQNQTEQNTNSSQFVAGPLPTIRAYGGEDRVELVGSRVSFSAQTEGVNGEPLDAERYRWNFGDGGVAEGKDVVHTYTYPGEYIVVLDVVSGVFSTSDTLYVTAIPADVVISEVSIEKTELSDGYISVVNETEHDIEVSGWYIESGNVYFEIPHGTHIKKGSEVRFDSSITGIFVDENDEIRLLYPNTALAYIYAKNNQNIAQQSLPTPNANDLHLENSYEIEPEIAVFEEAPVAEEEVQENYEIETDLSASVALAGVNRDSGGEPFFDGSIVVWAVSVLVLAGVVVLSFVIVGVDEIFSFEPENNKDVDVMENVVSIEDVLNSEYGVDLGSGLDITESDIDIEDISSE